jgi:prevent-host-death family protein
MKTIAVSTLRANLMKILKQIEQGETLDITSHGKVIATLVPPDHAKKQAREKLRELGNKARIYDIVSPIKSEWEAAE